MSEKKTEEQLRQEIIEEYSFDEEDERIDKILEIKKDRYAATQAKKKAIEEAETIKKRKDYYKNLANPKGDKSKDKNSSGDKTQSFTIVDQAAIISAGIKLEILEDVLEEVNNFGKMKGISVIEALKSSYIKGFITEKEEALRVADATNTGSSRKGKSEISESTLLDNFSKKGEFPESDEDMRRFAEARFKARS